MVHEKYAYSNKITRPPSENLEKTGPGPPAYIVPMIMTIIVDKNIAIICQVSVHTTAFKPPLNYIIIESINIEFT